MTKLTFTLEKVPTPTGNMLVITNGEGFLRTVDWEGYVARMHKLLRLHYGADAVALVTTPSPSPARREIEEYLAGNLTAIDELPIKTGGTDFQRTVWAALRKIPAGQTITYGTLAVRIGRSNAVRAVGLANGANPIGVVVPCHRVTGADGSLTGYGNGLDRKRWLLEHENVLGSLC